MKNPSLISKAILIVLLSFVTISCEKDDIQQPADTQSGIEYKLNDAGCPHVTDLIAGKQYDVGDIIITNDESNIYVTYLINEPGWYMKLSHMHVAQFEHEIPQNHKGNPKIGKFEYQMEHNKAIEYTIAVPYTWPAGTDIVVAAHAVVDFDETMTNLPDNAHLIAGSGTTQSYLTDYISEAGTLNGEYNAWCIDYGHAIYLGVPYEANVYSSIGDLSKLGQVDHPENLDKVNWLINQGFIGQTSSYAGSEFIHMDIQYAIWHIVDDNPPNYPNYPPYWDPLRLEELLYLAYAYGEDFIPGCDDKMAVVIETYKALKPGFKDIAQVTIIEVDAADHMVCGSTNYGEETAWGMGSPFGGGSWAMYIDYTICDNH